MATEIHYSIDECAGGRARVCVNGFNTTSNGVSVIAIAFPSFREQRCTEETPMHPETENQTIKA